MTKPGRRDVEPRSSVWRHRGCVLQVSLPGVFSKPAASVATALIGLAACAPAPEPVDLLRLKPLTDPRGGTRPGMDCRETGRGVRLNDVVRRTLPASPPSRLRFAVDIPRGAHLTLGCGIAPRFQEEPGVEFGSRCAKPAARTSSSRCSSTPESPGPPRMGPGRRGPSRYVGEEQELILETRGFEGGGGTERAYWGAPALTVPSRESPVVIVYLVDTLRADHTTPYGYARDTTPELAAFAKDAVVFESAIAQASWTKPSVASLLTSQLPGLHRAVQLRDPLDSGQLTLAEMLQAKGLPPGGDRHWVIYSEGNNFEQGFDVFAGLHGAGDRPSKLVEAAGRRRRGARLARRTSRLSGLALRTTRGPPRAYAAPAPFNRKFEPPPAEGRAAADPRTDLRSRPTATAHRPVRR